MKKMFMAALAAVSLMFMAVAPERASAATVIGSPFTAAGQSGGFFTFTSTPGTYDYTFTLTNPFKVLTQLQLNGDDPTSFSLFSGAPGGGSLIFASPVTSAPSYLSVLSAGDYYIRTVKSSSSMDFITGGVAISAVPEPATWAMMILGFFGLGAMLRRSRRTSALITA